MAAELLLSEINHHHLGRLADVLEEGARRALVLRRQVAGARRAWRCGSRGGARASGAGPTTWPAAAFMAAALCFRFAWVRAGRSSAHDDEAVALDHAGARPPAPRPITTWTSSTTARSEPRRCRSSPPPRSPARACRPGTTKAALTWDKALVAGFLAGAYIAFAGLLAVVASAGMDPQALGRRADARHRRRVRPRPGPRGHRRLGAADRQHGACSRWPCCDRRVALGRSVPATSSSC